MTTLFVVVAIFGTLAALIVWLLWWLAEQEPFEREDDE